MYGFAIVGRISRNNNQVRRNTTLLLTVKKPFLGAFTKFAKSYY